MADTLVGDQQDGWGFFIAQSGSKKDFRSANPVNTLVHLMAKETSPFFELTVDLGRSNRQILDGIAVHMDKLGYTPSPKRLFAAIVRYVTDLRIDEEQGSQLFCAKNNELPRRRLIEYLNF